MKELAKYAEILKALLKKTTTKTVSEDYRGFSKKYNIRRARVNATPSLQLPTLSKIYTARQLIAYIINNHALSQNIFAIEAPLEGKWNFIVHCREGKEKQAIALIDKALLECIPMWLPQLEEGILYLQCEGPNYLPTLLEYLANIEISDSDPQITLNLKYKLKTLTSNNRTICRRALSTRKNPTPAADHLANVSAILRDTNTRIHFAASFLSTLTDHCSSIMGFELYEEEKEAEAKTTREILQEAATMMLGYCKTYEHNPEEGRKIITTYYNTLIEKYPNLKENTAKYYKFTAIFGLFTVNSIATQLNDLASHPPGITLKINLAHIGADITKSVVKVTLQLMQNHSGLIATLESTVPDIRALIDFYDAPDTTERAKTTLSTKINQKLASAYVELLHNFLKDITTSEFNPNEAFENTLKLYLLFTEKLEAFGVKELRDNGRRCRLFALELLLKYYRDTKNWDQWEERSQYYFESMRDISTELVSNYKKVMIPFGMRADFYLAKEENDKAFEYYQTLCEYFFYINSPTTINPDRNLYEVANLGKRLLLAYTNSDDYFEVFLFCKDIITKIQEYDLGDEKTASELKLFILSYQSLWSTHSDNLCETIKKTQERSLPFVHDKFCITPTDIADQEYFIRALKKQDIPYALNNNDNTITLKNIPSIRCKSLEKALISTIRLKAKTEQYKANQKPSTHSDAENSYYSSSNPHGFFPAVETIGKIGFEPRIRSKKPASPPPDVNPVVKNAAAVQKRPELIINFGKHGTYKESRGAHQKIIALEGEHYKFGLFFGYINCSDADPRFLDVLRRGQIVGPKGQTGIKFFKIKDQETYKIKIVGSDICIVGECVADVDGHTLICFNRVQSHSQENREQKVKDGGVSLRKT